MARSAGSYEEILADPAIAAVYIPLPTTLHAEWVASAAAAKKHILLEKPLALSASSLLGMLQAAKSNDLAFMDGVMFNHHPRLQRMKASIQSGSLGAAGVREVSSGFCFRGDASFFASNIRVKPGADPLGCLGDLGWYNVRLSLWAYDYEMPSTVRAVAHRRTADGVPLHLSASMAWPDDAATTTASPGLGVGASRPATFFCSFLHTEQQWASVSGDAGRICLEDFVVPFSPEEAAFSVEKHEWGR